MVLESGNESVNVHKAERCVRVSSGLPPFYGSMESYARAVGSHHGFSKVVSFKRKCKDFIQPIRHKQSNVIIIID